MSKGAPGGGSGDGDKTGHAGGGGGGKERVQIRDGLTVGGADGKAEKETADEYGANEAQQNDLRGG